MNTAHRTRLTQLLLAIVAMLLVAGCGGGDETVTPPVTPAVTPPTTPGTVVGDGTTTTTDTAASSSLPLTNGSDLEGGLGSLDGINGLFTPLGDFTDETDSDYEYNQIDPDDSIKADAEEEVTTDTTSISFGPARIELDDQVYTVDKGGAFPSDDQLFEVISLTASSAVVELIAGEFSNGSSGITLRKGQTVTLVNQNEGITYKLKLITTTAGLEGAGYI